MRYTFLVFMFLVLSACGGPQSPDVDVQNAHIVDPVGGRDVTLGGLIITATGAPVRLIGASTPAAERVEIHTTSQNEAGRMQMRRLEDITITPGTPLEMGSGSTHLMVFGFDEALIPGDSVDLTLHFVQGDLEAKTLTVTALVTEIGASTSPHVHGS